MNLDPQAVPLAIEGIRTYASPARFRPMDGHLFEGWKRIKGAEVQPEGMPWERVRAMQALGARGDAASLAALIEVLHDETELVRESAENALKPHIQRLPVELFRVLARDTSVLNEEACRVAARVFGAHAESVPVEEVIRLLREAPEPIVAALAVWALGQYGDRAPIDIVAGILLAYFKPPPCEFPVSEDVRVRGAAAHALRTLGDRAPIDALIAGLYDWWTAQDAAQALLAHSEPIPEDMRRAAEAIANGKMRYLQSGR